MHPGNSDSTIPKILSKPSSYLSPIFNREHHSKNKCIYIWSLSKNEQINGSSCLHKYPKRISPS